ncbi:MAG: type III-B CRISPR module-associated protein Cmr5 [Candidatus Heimdallarchaeum aukensis]|uniref:CRISPR type III-B/RAMP module-associated protein Cmr5 n=1 Tax=Candidatus Heimdallarchaeum aukensis TaxID=2876573 RepID=A0A9Y1FM93_9ARCH|nr:MAG: type III-B CRISPR module-associated protein Cmr5 [Candidatus Heimdallarchaeum aukensis]
MEFLSDNDRAKFALASINEVIDDDEINNSSFLSYVKSLPATIVMNGLGQAIAMELASATPKPDNGDKKAHKKIVDIIETWLKKVNIFTDSNDLIYNITNATQDEYILAQIETLEFLGWLKKLAQAKVEVNEN